MWTMLAGVPGKLKMLLDRLTATRAANLDGLTSARTGYLDRLDATISSRAPASTALSTATWTAARAAKLDSTVLVNGVIKSVQTGYADPAAILPNGAAGQDYWHFNIGISAVGMNKSIVLFQPMGVQSAAPLMTARLTSSTNLRISKRGQSAPADYGTAGGQWTVLEFY